ncbi:DUF6331 family protein [Emticicia fontis]
MEEGISISNTEWIERIGFDESVDYVALEIDEFMGTFRDLINRLEVNCTADCCGADAFSFWAADIKSVSSKMDKKAILFDTKKLNAFIKDSDAMTIVSVRLNETFHKSVFLQLLNHMIVALEA